MTSHPSLGLCSCATGPKSSERKENTQREHSHQHCCAHRTPILSCEGESYRAAKLCRQQCASSSEPGATAAPPALQGRAALSQKHEARWARGLQGLTAKGGDVKLRFTPRPSGGSVGASPEDKRSRGCCLPPQVLRLKHGVLIAVQRCHLHAFIGAAQQTVLLPLRFLPPESRARFASSSVGPGAAGGTQHSGWGLIVSVH